MQNSLIQNCKQNCRSTIYARNEKDMVNYTIDFKNLSFIFVLETLCVAWFMVEFTIRFYCGENNLWLECASGTIQAKLKPLAFSAFRGLSPPKTMIPTWNKK
jgi:hypothetical protein